MGLFDGTPVPRWQNFGEYMLQSQEAGKGYGASFGPAFSQAFNRAQERAYAEKQQQVVTEKIQPVIEGIRGAKDFNDVMNRVGQHPEWMMDPVTAPYMLETIKNYGTAARIENEAKRAENASLETRVKLADTSDFIKRKLALSPEQRAGVESVPGNPDGTPTPAQLQALRLAEHVESNARVEARIAAEEAARKRGDIPTTTITPKGDVGITYKPKPTEEQVSYPKPTVETYETPEGKVSVLMYRNFHPMKLGEIPQEKQTKIRLLTNKITRLQSEEAKYMGTSRSDKRMREAYDSYIKAAEKELDTVFSSMTPRVEAPVLPTAPKRSVTVQSITPKP